MRGSGPVPSVLGRLIHFAVECLPAIEGADSAVILVAIHVAPFDRDRELERDRFNGTEEIELCRTGRKRGIGVKGFANGTHTGDSYGPARDLVLLTQESKKREQNT